MIASLVPLPGLGAGGCAPEAIHGLYFEAPLKRQLIQQAKEAGITLKEKEILGVSRLRAGQLAGIAIKRRRFKKLWYLIMTNEGWYSLPTSEAKRSVIRKPIDRRAVSFF